MEIILALIVGVIVGALLGYFVARVRHAASQVEAQKALATQQAELAAQQAAQQATLQAEQKAALERMELQHAAERKASEDKQKADKEQMELRLQAILAPLQTNIRAMQEAMSRNDKQQADTMSRLDESIRLSLERTEKMGEQADRLATALTGENKTQGNFGELRLRQMLEQMGLERGVQFEEQVTMQDEHARTIYDTETNERMQPDVVLHFPDDRDIIIDSKMSLTDFEAYHNAEDEDVKRAALKRHVASVRKHVEELSRKNYSSYVRQGHTRLDFVVMYVFSESALQLALSAEPTLWKEAYDKGVLITGSQNLYALLRVLEISWKQMLQVENQERIMDAANQIVDRVQAFYERFLKVDEQLRKTQEAFNDVKNITQQSGQSIFTPAQKLLKYGAKENPKRKQRLPKEQNEITDESEA